jgi:hypothetical protein
VGGRKISNGAGTRAPTPPRHLGNAGLALWQRVQSEYSIRDAGGVELLCLACQALDRAEALSNAIAVDGMTLRIRGGIRAHPALRDELANRAFVTRTLAKLGITSEPIQPPGRPGSAFGWIPPT